MGNGEGKERKVGDPCPGDLLSILTPPVGALVVWEVDKTQGGNGVSRAQQQSLESERGQQRPSSLDSCSVLLQRGALSRGSHVNSSTGNPLNSFRD